MTATLPVFRLAGFSLRLSCALLAAFALVTPLGLWAGGVVVLFVERDGIAVLTALAAGTFLFVALCDLLPEVFHHREDALLKVVLVLAGIALSVAFA